ncbi:Beta-barrel assembly machine subunit BamD [Desulfuromusa kysingii]|uniref:Beta-barrel assembly machine subunit BamD n=1 Tax=Desulfuromusa kysingii TaxID=37625 RepID=A0A1H3WTC0_9BACT|nr:outer membrane protein assembly factor BamD [Desulfuromusa kysingii]SDZ89991.1 Beta-barrel assembly machine subunit BamD [Desulfuromusa kysingii]
MKQVYKWLIPFLICLLLAACGGSKAKPENSAEKYFREGEKNFESNLIDDAIASWEKVRDTFYSPELSMLAELKIAEAYYVSERYEEAALAYQDFLKQHPSDFRSAMIHYRMGLSYYQQILSPDRDQTSTKNAMKSFQKLITQFPNDPHAQEARNLIQRCRTRLAEHEVYVGQFYLKRKQYQPAIKRLEGILETFPDYYYRDEAYFYLLKAYLITEQRDKAQIIYDKLLTEFSGSDFVEDAQELFAEK